MLSDPVVRPMICAPVPSDAVEKMPEERAAFLRDVRRFLSSALTPELREAGRKTIGVHSDIAACRIWHRRLYEQGWVAPSWPAAFGGAAWPVWKQLLFEHECAANDAPILFAGGLRNVGPLLIAIGTRQQQARYLPAILDGRDLWCQGFSEPGAGSDLAALRTRATADGDCYVVDGSKIWTTGAHIANRMFCLVRTSTTGPPQAGITFLLIDMHSEGLSVRPIRSIAGEHEFNEVIFEGVRVPKANRVGEENDGWAVAKLLMSYARASNTTSAQLRRSFRRAAEMSLDTQARQRLRELECRLNAFEATEALARGRGAGDRDSSRRASMLKTLATELHQEITTIALDAAGPSAAAPNTAAAPSTWLEAGGLATAKYFATRAASIYSGTNETHRNLIAKHLLRF
jgi:acyl-CoA dehydrogenase